MCSCCRESLSFEYLKNNNTFIGIFEALISQKYTHCEIIAANMIIDDAINIGFENEQQLLSIASDFKNSNLSSATLSDILRKKYAFRKESALALSVVLLKLVK